MKDINYLEIIKKSWKITWEKKYLWWFGFFMTLGSGLNFNFPGNSDWNKKIEEKGYLIEKFFNQNWQIIIFSVVLFAAIFFVLRIISQAGLIKSLNRIENNQEGDFRIGFKEGKKYFWKIFLAGLILVLLIFILLVILSVPVIFIFYFKSLIFGILVGSLAAVILIPSVIISSYIGKYACFYIILSDLGIRSALENGYQIFRRNILSSIIMALFFVPVNIILFLLVIFSAFVIGIIFFIIGLILGLIFSKIGISIVLISGVIVFMTSLFFINSLYQVICQTIWFLFFKEIAIIKEEEKALETEREIIEESLPSPEEA